MNTSTFYTQRYYNGLLTDLEFVNTHNEVEVCKKFNADSKADFLEVLMAEIVLTEEELGIEIN